MKQYIVMTVLGDDSSGLVKSLSEIIVAHQGEWVESNMIHLSGKFAGILRINLPVKNIDDFCQHLSESKLGLQVAFERVRLKEVPIKTNAYTLDLIGQDQLGIVNKLSSALAKIQVNVEQLNTEVIEASMSGEQLFKANIMLSVPINISEEDLQDALVSIADELILDLELQKK